MIISRTLTLLAADFYSKWGFSDGEAAWEFAADHGYEGDADPLIPLVEKYLVPLLPPGFEVETYPSAHNPIRATDYGIVDRSAELKGIAATVTAEQVLEICRELDGK